MEENLNFVLIFVHGSRTARAQRFEEIYLLKLANSNRIDQAFRLIPKLWPSVATMRSYNFFSWGNILLLRFEIPTGCLLNGPWGTERASERVNE